ncbi:hypothetical protein [Methylobacterium sp. NEAU K]|uniref:hypothetical protein n=1 Tax=Methylobacterium sp. NEAU K TaxID=3064946 RepID=UPI002736948E|nr:hypothetical protein [Methylobacterium sp. NEAU K]MDP4006956.1 hypothetical protein [Methylobacterium sp. NEAU K]
MAPPKLHHATRHDLGTAYLCTGMTHRSALTDLPAAIDFWRDQFGAEAHRSGWTAAQLFGFDSEHCTFRIDRCGVPMIDGKPMQVVKPNRILFERTAPYRNRPVPEWGESVWDFAAKGD